MSASDIQKLREATGAGVMDCKKALDEAGGNFQKALDLIAKAGFAKADKKGERQTGAGYLEAYIHSGRVGVLLDVRAETDFVTRSQDFKDMARNLAMHIAASSPASLDELLSQPYIKDESMNVESYIKTVIGKLGENIKVERFSRFEV